jgi:nucleoside-diphosphate-sugar epimerase
MKLYADISKAKRILGWKEEINFEEGIRNTIDFYRKI